MSLACMVLLAAPCLHIWTFVGGSLLPGCPEMCKCDGEQMRCEQFIPRTVPNNISEILLSFNHTNLSPGIFCNVSWSNVIKLSISYTSPWAEDSFRLDAYVFMCLKQIQVLKLHTTNRFNSSKNSLYELDSVTVLDLSGCTRLETEELVIQLSVKANIANLKKLILSGFGSVFVGLDISQDLIDVLVDKNITELDLTNTGVSAYRPNISGICDTLKIMNLSNSDINFNSHFDKFSPCKSLSILDLNGAIFPFRKYIKTIFINDHEPIKRNYIFLKHLDVLHLSRLISVDQIGSFSNCSFTGLGESYNLKELQLNGYNIRNLDIDLVNLFDQLQYLELSGNRIQSIGPNIFKTFKQLIKLDLSKNRLSQSRLFDETFSVLFKNNLNLKQINLNDNGLRHLPPATFSSNKLLRRIDISNNKIQQITFDVSRLINLNILDMRNYSVQSLDKISRGALDTLYEMQRLVNHTKSNTSTFLIDLRANPFTCECDSLPFIKWFIVSPIFNTTIHHYHCKLDGREIEMNDKAVAAAEETVKGRNVK